MLEQVMTGTVVAATTATVLRIGARHRNREPPCHVDLSHLLMGLGMVAMHLTASPLSAAPFLVLSAWLGLLALRRRSGSHLHHSIGALAMAYMFACSRTGTTESSWVATEHAHHTTATIITGHAPGFTFPLVAWLFLTYCLLSAGFAGTDLLRDPHTRVRTAVELAISASMAHMFLVML